MVTDTAVAGDDLTVASGAGVVSTAGSIMLEAGDVLTVDLGATLQSTSGNGVLKVDTAAIDPDPGNGGSVGIFGSGGAGAVFGIHVIGGMDGDVFLLNPNAAGLGRIQLAGEGGNDNYLAQLGHLTGGSSAVTVGDLGAGGGVDMLSITGGSAGETFDVNPMFTLVGGVGINYDATLEILEIQGMAGADVFNVAPSQTLLIHLFGGDPAAAPGDSLNVQTPLQASTFDVPAGPGSGTIQTTGGYLDVTYNEIEGVAGLNVRPGLTLDADASSGAAPGGFQTSYLTVSGAPVNIADTDVDVSDPDPGAVVSTIFLTAGGILDAGAEVLHVGGMDFQISGGSGQTTAGGEVFNVSVTATGANALEIALVPQSGAVSHSVAEALLSSTTYFNLAATPTPGLRTFDIVVVDGTSVSTSARATIQVETGTFTFDADSLGMGLDNDIHVNYLLATSEVAVSIDGTPVLQRPATQVLGLVFNGQSGDDILTVDYGGGSPSGAMPLLPPIVFNGGDNLGGARPVPGDALVLQNGTVSNQTFKQINANDGEVLFDGVTVISYTGLEPVHSSLAAAHVMLDFEGGAETIVIANSGAGQTSVDSTLGELVTFLNPASSLTVNGGGGDDMIDFTGLAPGFPASLAVHDGDGNDAVNVNVSLSLEGGTFTVTAESVGGGADISTNGGAVNIAAGAGGISLGAIDTSRAVGVGGGVLLDSATSILIGLLRTAGQDGAGQVNLIASGGSLTTGDIESFSTSGSGGAVTLNGATSILIGLLRNTGGVDGGPIQLTTGDLMLGGAQTGGSGLISLTADNLALGGNISGNGGLIIQPRNPTASIGLGGGTGTLNLDDGELALLQDGFSSVMIGTTTVPITNRGPIIIQSAAFNDAVTLAGNAIHDLDGTDLTAPLVKFDGNVSPGQSPGILQVTGNFALADGAGVSVEIGGVMPGTGAANHDQIAVAGTVSIGSGVTLGAALTGGFAPSIGGSFLIIDNDGSDAVVGTFVGLAEGAVFSSAACIPLRISYVGGDGNDVVLTVPTAAEQYDHVMMAAGLAGPDAAPEGVPFRDGVMNLLKYAFNMSLSGNDSRMLVPGTGLAGLPAIFPQGSAASSVLRFEFLRRIGSGLVFTPMKSTGLDAMSWIPLTDVPDVVPVNVLWERVIYEEPFDPAVTPRLFGMVEVMLP